ncbi:Crp/Fnr family transcriptional regulator [Aquidulcibacter paucihalophilus]|jgi:CRP-like cAMP-binding protein|nr:Crp/Fnr family transcriptional regulator [Aquidulcibacter paucihalophilus]
MTNALLAGLGAEDRMALMAVGQKRAFLRGQLIGAAGGPINAVLFVESGSVAAAVPMKNGEAVEVFSIGDEAVTGGWGGQTHGAYRLVTKTDVTGLAVDIRSLVAIIERRSAVRAVLLDYGVRLSMELAQNSVCNLTHRTDERLAKWLLRQHDRVGGVPIQETVAGVAQILGVQRKAARGAFDSFREAGAIETTRGSLTVSDRAVLEDRVCECYDASRSVRDIRMAAAHECRQVAAGGGRRMSGMA